MYSTRQDISTITNINFFSGMLGILAGTHKVDLM